MSRLFLILVAFILSIRIVFAQNFLDYIFRPFGGIDVASFYDSYWYVIDFILYLIVFLGIARVSLEKRFKGPGGKALITVLGIMLTIGMTWFASSVGFRVTNLWPVAAGLFIGIIAFLIFRLMSGQGANLKKGVATAYVVTFLAVQAIIPELAGRDGWIATEMPIAWGIANMLFLVAIVYMIGELGRFFSHGRKAEGRDDWPIRGRTSTVPWTHTTSRTPTTHLPPPVIPNPTPVPAPGPTVPEPAAPTPEPGTTPSPPGGGDTDERHDILDRLEKTRKSIYSITKKVRDLKKGLKSLNGDNWEKQEFVPQREKTLEIIKQIRSHLDKIPKKIQSMERLIGVAKQKNVEGVLLVPYESYVKNLKWLIQKFLEWCGVVEEKCRGQLPGPIQDTDRLLPSADKVEQFSRLCYKYLDRDDVLRKKGFISKDGLQVYNAASNKYKRGDVDGAIRLIEKAIGLLEAEERKLKKTRKLDHNLINEYARLRYKYLSKSHRLESKGINLKGAFILFNRAQELYTKGSIAEAIETLRKAIAVLDKLGKRYLQDQVKLWYSFYRIERVRIYLLIKFVYQDKLDKTNSNNLTKLGQIFKEGMQICERLDVDGLEKFRAQTNPIMWRNYGKMVILIKKMKRDSPELYEKYFGAISKNNVKEVNFRQNYSQIKK